MKKIIITIILINLDLYSQSAGNIGLSFLKFGFGARNLALADLGSVISDDLTALHYNPSRLKSERNEVFVAHNSWIQDINSQLFGIKTDIYGFPIAFGFNITNVDDIEIRTRPGEPEAKFNANYFYGSLSSAYRFSNDISIGATIRYIYEGILNYEASGVGFDFGLTYTTPVENLTLSSVVRNIGSMNSLRNKSTELPSEFRLSSQYKFTILDLDTDLMIAAEYQKYFKSNYHLNFGIEFIYNKLFSIRSGYQTNYESRDLTAGFGLIWGNLKLDYAFIPFKLSLGNVNVFSISFLF
ncbi:MAG: PorV/PorQ family protein [Ignavibacterium sp.]|nr:PorV/PorQ family protein [Ignavibacterium sp.]MDW8375839.1 PorV/PorQ family protein [Ignavibacteriales bacterium]